MSVVLRPACRADGPDLLRAHQVSRPLHVPWVEPFTEHEQFETWLAGHATGNSIGFVARDGDGGPVVGVTTLSQIFFKAFRNAYLSYWAMDGFQGRGLMAQALRLTLAHAFEELGLHRVEANIQPGNAPSLALVRRLGFRHEGFSPRYLMVDGDWRDHERFAILAEEFAAQR